ncbi:MAG: ATP-binding protein [Gammaproteobacteria bacterium]|nr:ATP-binding protein [Gammaproteobacteria bacterium]
MKNLSLSLQISVLVSICMFIGTLLYGSFQVNVQSDKLIQQKHREVDALVRNIAASSMFFLVEEDYVALENLLQKSTGFPDINSIIVTDPTGTIVAEVARKDGEVAIVYSGRKIDLPVLVEPGDLIDDKGFNSWSPILFAGEMRGWAFVTADLDFVRQQQSEIWQQTVVAGTIIFFLGFFAIQLFLARKMKALGVATEFAQGLSVNRGKELPITMGTLELNRLVESLNLASKKLAEQESRLIKRTEQVESSNARLKERIKELNCIYNLSRILSDNSQAVEKKLQAVVEAIPPSFLYPEISCSRLIYLGQHFVSRTFRETEHVIKSNIECDGEIVGSVEVVYLEEMPALDEGPFLQEERSLINEIGARLGVYFQRLNIEQALREANTSLEVRVRERTRDLEIAKKQAEEASNAKSSFLSRMSHELRTPLNAILGFGELLKLDRGLSTEQLENVTEIVSAGTHLLNLINEVLDLTRIEASGQAIQQELISPVEVTREVVTMMRNMVAKDGLTMHFVFRELNSARFRTDPVKFKQILINLIGNAVKYNRSNGSIDVNVYPTGMGWVRFEVSDTGIGIADENINKVFEPFERLGQEYVVEGTGIGLTVTRSLVELLGGRIKVNSVLGEGTTFSVEFPLASGQSDNVINFNP